MKEINLLLCGFIVVDVVYKKNITIYFILYHHRTQVEKKPRNNTLQSALLPKQVKFIFSCVHLLPICNHFCDILLGKVDENDDKKINLQRNTFRILSRFHIRSSGNTDTMSSLMLCA